MATEGKEIDVNNATLNQDARVRPFFLKLVRDGLKATFEEYGFCDPLKDGPPPKPNATTALPIVEGAKTITIIGAGMAGLAAARELLREGFNVVMIEKDTRVGGRLKSFRSKAFTDDGVVEAGGMRIPGKLPPDVIPDSQGKPGDPYYDNVHYLTDYYISELCKIETTPFKNKEDNAYISLFRKNRQTGDDYERITRQDFNERELEISEEMYPGWDEGPCDARLEKKQPWGDPDSPKVPKYPKLSQGAKDAYNIRGVSSIWTATMSQLKEELVDVCKKEGPDRMWEVFTITYGNQGGYDFLRTPHPEILQDDPENTTEWKRWRIRPLSEEAIQGYTDTSYMGPRLEYSLIETMRDEFGPWWGDWMYTIGTGMDELPTKLFQEIAKLEHKTPGGKSNLEVITGADVYGLDVITEAQCADEKLTHEGEAPTAGGDGDHDNQNELYCELDIPLDLLRVENLIVSFEAKNQGWADHPEQGKWAWIEAQIVTHSGATVGQRITVCTPDIKPEWDTYVANKGVFEKILAGFQPGSKIQFYLMSRFGGWRCYCRKITMDIQYVPVTLMSGYFEQQEKKRIIRVNKIAFDPPLTIGDDGKIVSGRGTISGSGTAEIAEGNNHVFNIVKGKYNGKEVFFTIDFEDRDAKDDDHAETRARAAKELELTAEDLHNTTYIFVGEVSPDQTSISGQWYQNHDLGGKYSGDFLITTGTSVRVKARTPESTYLPRKRIPVTHKRTLAAAVDTYQECYANKVIVTVPLPIFRQFNVNPPLSIAKQQAINSVFYTPSTKVCVEYSKKFWMEEGIGGGISKTTDIVGQIVYPTTSSPDGNVHDELKDTPGILVSYTWQQNAVTLGGITPEEQATVVRRCINRMHPGTNANGEVVHEGAEHYFIGNQVSGDGDKKPHYNAQIWHNDPYAQGAILHWTSHQYSNYYNAIMCPEYSSIYIAGEGASWANAWVQGALQSGLRAAYMIYCQLQTEKHSIIDFLQAKVQQK